MKLYKYTSWRPFDKDGSPQECYARNNLLNSQLHFSSATDFNDPFDISPYIDLRYNYTEMLETCTKLVMREDGLSRVKARRRAIEVIRSYNLMSPAGRKAGAERAMSALSTTGVCCFTLNSPETLLMWAHYGDSHKGICLSFHYDDKARLFGPENPLVLNPIPVIYSDKLPEIAIYGDDQETKFNCIRTKSTEWSYENEYRSLYRRKTGLVKYNEWCLDQVIAGCKMPERELQELKDTILKMTNRPRLLLAKKREREFGLELVNIKL